MFNHPLHRVSEFKEPSKIQDATAVLVEVSRLPEKPIALQKKMGGTVPLNGFLIQEPQFV
jgi:hypothetical protein